MSPRVRRNNGMRYPHVGLTEENGRYPFGVIHTLDFAHMGFQMSVPSRDMWTKVPGYCVMT